STPVLNRLVNMRFVTKETGRYYMHPVDRAYALQRLDPDLAAGSGQKPARSQKASVNTTLLSSVRRSLARSSALAASPVHPFTLSPLRHRAADSFRATRTPPADWKSLTALTPQLAEIDLRYAAGDYDTAAQVLREIGFDYLLLWGHSQLMIDQHERLQGKLS